LSDPNEISAELNIDDALKLARQGKDVWNTWAADPANAGTSVCFSHHDFTSDPIGFSGFIFPGPVSFQRCKFNGPDFSETIFKGDADFINAEFHDQTTFRGACFHGEVNFRGTQFGSSAYFNVAKFYSDAIFGGVMFAGGVRFQNAEFEGEAGFRDASFFGKAWFNDSRFAGEGPDFHSVEFGGPMYLDGAVFEYVPEFRYTKITNHFTLHRVEVKYHDSDQRAKWLGLSWAKAADGDDVDRYRRLKELANVAKDHEREQYFFALELKAKRHYETTGCALLLNYAYGWFSGFGRSVWRPLVGLIGVWGMFGVGHGMFAKLDTSMPYLEGLRLSAAVLLPFVSSARTIYEKASTAVYGQAPARAWVLDLAVVMESMLGLIFIFLLGLALRNRFRL